MVTSNVIKKTEQSSARSETNSPFDLFFRKANHLRTITSAEGIRILLEQLPKKQVQMKTKLRYLVEVVLVEPGLHLLWAGVACQNSLLGLRFLGNAVRSLPKSFLSKEKDV